MSSVPDTAALNQVTLDAQISQIEGLRYTPAGVPVLDLVLTHESAQMQAQVMRQLQVQINAVMIGPQAVQLAKVALGQTKRFSGFLANRSARGGKLTGKLEFHITQYQDL